MSAYYVIAIVIVAGAVVLSAIGLTRENFPPDVRVGRAVMAGTLVAVIVGIVALIATTEKEHPREEAAEAASEEQAVEEGKRGSPKEGGTIAVTEKEYSITIEGGNELEAGSLNLSVANEGKIEHDLAIEGEQIGDEPKTPLIKPASAVPLEVELPAGEYKFYCTVPGHEQSGMKTDVTVK
jgi:uncharacterized cupredoxin-like copper-binding protein